MQRARDRAASAFLHSVASSVRLSVEVIDLGEGACGEERIPDGSVANPEPRREAGTCSQ
jgi:hypothetical protein